MYCFFQSPLFLRRFNFSRGLTRPHFVVQGEFLVHITICVRVCVVSEDFGVLSWFTVPTLPLLRFSLRLVWGVVNPFPFGFGSGLFSHLQAGD